MRYCFITIAFFALSCSRTTTEEENVHYIERTLSFYDPFEPVWKNGKNQGEIYDNWLRKPENLKMLHETFKKIGYKTLISEEDRFSTIVSQGIQIRRPMNELIDSLLITYVLDTISSKYYNEFWDRRTKEGNQETVYSILQEVSTELYEDHLIQHNDNLVNDTLYHLLTIREFEDSITTDIALRNFQYLKEIGLHQSAYNLLYERYRYYDINWNQDALEKELLTDTIDCCPWPWIEDDSK